MKLRTLLLAGATMGLAAALALPATAQDRDSRGWQQNHSRWGWAQDRDDHGRNDNGSYANSNAYRNGYQDARNDRDHHHEYRLRGDRWKGNDRQAYEAGYRAGYNGQYGGGGWNQDRDRDRDRDNRGTYGRGGVYPQGGRGGYGNGMAARMGYQDGLMYGRNDASRGKGYNATGSGYYEHADHGYNSSFGDKNQYRQEYRQAYQQGYQQGYQGGRYPGRR